MQTLADTMNMIWSVLTVVAQVLSLVLIASFFSRSVRQSAVVRFLSDSSVLVGLVAAILSTVGSLIYSDVIGFEPCKLCWFQRIFMYPQVIVLGMALKLRHGMIKVYGLVLSVIGGIIALYHYLGQLGVASLPCSAVGYSASCATKFVLQFGYITIPLMAFSAFLLMSLSFAASIRADRDTSRTS